MSLHLPVRKKICQKPIEQWNPEVIPGVFRVETGEFTGLKSNPFQFLTEKDQMNEWMNEWMNECGIVWYDFCSHHWHPPPPKKKKTNIP